jgi:hypothetical protein
MADGIALYHADHGNLAASGTILDEENLAAAIQAMRLQTSLDGLTLNVSPRFLVVGPAREVAARKLLAAITPAKSSDVNIFAGSMEIVVDANIADHRWYLFADPAIYPAVVYGYLVGRTGPQMRSEIDFDTQALKVAVGLDFGAGAIDTVGTYLNAGAAA